MNYSNIQSSRIHRAGIYAYVEALTDDESLELSMAFSGLIGPGLEPVEIDLKELEV